MSALSAAVESEITDLEALPWLTERLGRTLALLIELRTLLTERAAEEGSEP